MSTYTINDINQSAHRYKLYTLMCCKDELSEHIAFLQTKNLNIINIGKELAAFINGLEDYSYLHIDVFEFTKKLLEKNKSKINNTGNEVVAIYNLGILLEPALELNSIYLLKEFSKSAALIIIWENQCDIPDRLNWPTQKDNFYLDFTEIQLKQLQYAL